MIAMPTVGSVSEAWVLGLERVVSEPGGRLVHLVSTVSEPGAEIASVRRVLDAALDAAGKQSVDTVAETIFPSSLYPDPGFNWTPGIAADNEAELDTAADKLYTSYCDMLPLLSTAAGNSRGTYFGRMVSWPGKVAGGPNQLADRIRALRGNTVPATSGTTRSTWILLPIRRNRCVAYRPTQRPIVARSGSHA